MIRVDIEEIRRIQAERKKFNDLNIDEIEWYKDGKKVEINQEMLEEFKFTGLCNTDFITMNFYKHKSL